MEPSVAYIMRLWPGIGPGPRWGSSRRRFPRSPSRQGWDTPPCTSPHSVLPPWGALGTGRLSLTVLFVALL